MKNINKTALLLLTMILSMNMNGCALSDNANSSTSLINNSSKENYWHYRDREIHLTLGTKLEENCQLTYRGFKYRFNDNEFSVIDANDFNMYPNLSGNESYNYLMTSYDGYPVAKIEANALSDCKRLEFLHLPSTLKRIGDNAFSGCSSLKVIVIPSGVTYIGESAFEGCDNLTIYCEANNNELNGWDENWNSSNRPVYYPGEWTWWGEFSYYPRVV